MKNKAKLDDVHVEDWRAPETKTGPNQYAIVTEDDQVVGELESREDMLAWLDRACCCVNACAGINPEAIPLMLAALRRYRDCEDLTGPRDLHGALLYALSKAEV